MLHGVRHALTPGTPVYGALKFGALGSVFLLQRTVRKRAQHSAPQEPVVESRSRATPHPRSKKKKRRRR